jgi:hypothetical protein
VEYAVAFFRVTGRRSPRFAVELAKEMVMRRRYQWVVSGCALLAACALVVQGFAQEKKAGEKTAPPEKAPPSHVQQAPGGPAPTTAPSTLSPEEMMKMYQELNALGPQQEEMTKAAGKYNVLVKYWMMPGAPEQQSKGVAEFQVVLGGHFLQQKFAGEMEGQPYEGLGLEGYDPVKKQYQSVWLDSMTNQMMYSTGTASEDGKVITYTSTMDDVLTGRKNVPIKMVLRKISDDKAVFEMYVTLPDGKEFKTMEMEYTRQK